MTIAPAEGLELIGQMQGSGYREPPALVRRADGQTVQLTPLLYAVLEEIADGGSTEEVAERVSARLGRTVTADNVETLVDSQLRPLGLLKRADGSEPELKRSNPLLGLRWKFTITDPRITRRLTAPFAVLFNPLLVFAVTAAFVAVAWWVLLQKGLASATYEAFQNPGLLLVIVAVMLTSAGFHEFGHAAAARRGGSDPGAMGGGIYLVWPAFYTDVTDSYRLGRGGRLRTDLGGLYFDAMVSVAVFGVWFATRWDGWLLVVAAQVLGMLRQLTPLVRFDGYHILCDLTGVPDLFQRIKPVLLSFLPKYWKSPEVAALKPWVRVVVTLWVLIVVPTLLFALLALLFALPRIAGTSWERVQQHAQSFSEAVGDGEVVEALGRVVAMMATGFPVLAITLMLSRLAWGVGKRAWVSTSGKPAKRAGAGAVALLLIGVLVAAWWPRPDRYAPVQPWERGTLADFTPVAALRPPVNPGVGYRSSAQVNWPEGQTRPTRARPQLALVLIPRGTEPGTTPAAGATAGAGEDQTWVFPFNRPLEPGEGDNQAMAVNYTDGGTRYDVAFAMVWVEDGADALNRNEAYALASCQQCTTVSVAFQVVFVVGQSDVIIPQNISAAVNYNCLSCVTVALAQQLLVTVDAVPSEEALARIQELWVELKELEGRITELSFAEIAQALDSFEVEVLAVLEEDGVLKLPGSDGPSPSGTPTGSSSPSESPTGSPTGANDGARSGPATGPATGPTTGPAPRRDRARAPGLRRRAGRPRRRSPPRPPPRPRRRLRALRPPAGPLRRVPEPSNRE